MGDEDMLSLAEVEFEFGQLLLDVASGECKSATVSCTISGCWNIFRRLRMSLMIARKTRK
jgi:hypothetical protein